MDLKKVLLQEHSKAQANKVVAYIGDDPEKFKQLMKLFFNETYRVTQRAAWPMSICVEKNPALIKPYLSKMINKLTDQTVAVKRNSVRALQFIDIPTKLQGKAVNACFDLLNSPSEAIAVKVFAMTVLANICEKQPDLANELQLSIESQMPLGSAGFKSRGKKILARLHKLS
ncbi:MAG: hypothetical protein ABJH05_14990 [Fulvivirga sp.]